MKLIFSVVLIISLAFFVFLMTNKPVAAASDWGILTIIAMMFLKERE
jgi:hypothetical protein